LVSFADSNEASDIVNITNSSISAFQHNSLLGDSTRAATCDTKAAMSTVTPNRAHILFELAGHVAIVNGGADHLGYHHGAILAAAGANVVLLDLAAANPAIHAEQLQLAHGPECLGISADITSEKSLQEARDVIMAKFGRIDILINNAANNPKVEATSQACSRLENVPIQVWNDDIAVGLTGAFLCSRVFGVEMVKRNSGVILNVASDQRLDGKEGGPDHEQPIESVTSSVVKTALIGLTRFLSTYWTAHNIRCNAISPGGVNLHSLTRMTHKDEYQGAVLFLCSDASSHITGQNLIVAGGCNVL
jgi:NAD(P)-dependent dehydrogenase (short-subunit alcohol dehydrogenase family)